MARSAGEGTISENKARGRWEGQLTISYDPTSGKRKRQKFTGKTRREVVAKMDDARRALGEGRATASERRTVGQYLDEWTTDILPGTISSSTLAGYRDVVRLYIKPHIGAKRITTLSPTDVTRMIRALEADGRSANTQRLARSILRRALRRAEQEGVVSRNVAAIADGPKVGTVEGRTLTVDQAKALLAAAADHDLGAAFTVALTLGLRRGELLAITWDDVDLDGDKPTLTITKALKRIPKVGLEVSETKTPTSRRRIHLPAPTAAALKAHRVKQVAQQLKVGESWPAKPLGYDLVFRTPVGTAVDPDNFRNATYRLTQLTFTPEEERPKRGEPWPVEYRWSPHELRHSAASLLIAQGVDLKVVSEVLGHSSIRITADVYGHLLDDAGIVAADAMTELLG